MSNDTRDTLENLYDEAYNRGWNHALEIAIITIKQGDLEKISLFDRTKTLISKISELKKNEPQPTSDPGQVNDLT